MSKSMIILGAGGHAKVVLSVVQELGINVLCLTDSDPSKYGDKVLGVEVEGGDEILSNINPDNVDLAIGIGACSGGKDLITPLKRRFSIFLDLAKKGFAFPALIHPNAWVANDCSIGQGAQIFAGAIIQPGCSIGDLAIINTKVSIDHDSNIGKAVHLAPGVTCGGSTKVGGNSYIGIGATILNNIRVGQGAVVAAGSLVNSYISDGTKVSGTPARVMTP